MRLVKEVFLGHSLYLWKAGKVPQQGSPSRSGCLSKDLHQGQSWLNFMTFRMQVRLLQLCVVDPASSEADHMFLMGKHTHAQKMYIAGYMEQHKRSHAACCLGTAGSTENI